MKKKLIISLMLIVAIITLSTAFIPFKDSRKIETKTNFDHPEAGYIQSIGN